MEQSAFVEPDSRLNDGNEWRRYCSDAGIGIKMFLMGIAWHHSIDRSKALENGNRTGALHMES